MSILFGLKMLLWGVNSSTIAYLICCVALYTSQHRLIFKPCQPIPLTPRELGLTYEDIWLPVIDAQGKPGQIHGWWIPAPSSSGNPSGKPTGNPSGKTLLYLHGNGCTINANLTTAQRFLTLGFSLLMIDYRGYGRSQGGFPREAEVYRDAQAAWDYLVHERHILPENLYLYGHSLGGAIAIDLAVRRPQSAGLIVENTFTSMKAMVDYQKYFRWLPVDRVLHQRFDSLAKLSLLQIPLLVIHGTLDRTVPLEMGQHLFDRASVPKRHLWVPDAGHNNTGSAAGQGYFDAIAEFIALAQPTRRYASLQ